MCKSHSHLVIFLASSNYDAYTQVMHKLMGQWIKNGTLDMYMYMYIHMYIHMKIHVAAG